MINFSYTLLLPETHRLELSSTYAHCRPSTIKHRNSLLLQMLMHHDKHVGFGQVSQLSNILQGVEAKWGTFYSFILTKVLEYLSWWAVFML